MGVLVKLTSSMFHRRPLPVHTILGEKLAYGNTEDYAQTICGEMGRREFIAYLPEHIGRGFQVIWHEGEKRSVTLRLPQPCCEAELREFYETVKRIAEFWKARISVNGKATTLRKFLSTLAENISINVQAVRDLGRDIINRKACGYEIYGAMWPLRPGEREGRQFMLSPESFGEWLHEKQEIDACYWPIVYGVGQDGRSAKAVTIFNPFEVPCIYLDKVPDGFTTMDTHTGRRVPVTEWTIIVNDGEGLSCEITYEEFRSGLPADRVSRYDDAMILIQPMTGEEIRAVYFAEGH